MQSQERKQWLGSSSYDQISPMRDWNLPQSQKPSRLIRRMIKEIIEELKISKVSERSGRAMDHEEENVFERLRTKGYM